MNRVRSVLDPKYTGTIVCVESNGFVRVQWDDGRNMLHFHTEIEPEDKED